MVSTPWDSTLNRPVPNQLKSLSVIGHKKYFCAQSDSSLFSCYFRDFLFEGVRYTYPARAGEIRTSDTGANRDFC